MILRRILLKLWRRRNFEREIEAELAFHRDLAQKHSNPIGLGNVTRIQEEARDLWRFSLLEDFLRDVGYALRSLRRTPGFAVVAILTLALGIGANTAIFTLFHRVMLSWLPVEDPQQLIEVLGTRRAGQPPGTAFSYQALQNFRSNTQTSSVIGFSNITLHTVIGGNAMERVPGLFVTGDYFSTLGVSTMRGRPITPEDDRTGGANAVAVISHALWQSHFGGDPNTIGKTVTLENVPFTIIGVAPAGFSGLEIGRPIDIWVPLEIERRMRQPSYTSSPGFKWVRIVGRLKHVTTIEQAWADMAVLYSKSVIENEIADLQQENPRFDPQMASFMRTWSLLVEPAGTGLLRTREQYATPLKVLMGIVAFLLLIACTNIANLLFARALGREKEMALRLSLGARRSRLVRQLLTESVVLVTAGGVLGLMAAYLLTKYLTAFLTSANGLILDAAPNVPTLGFTAAVAIGAVVLFGLAPAWRNTDINFADKLKPGMNSSTGLKSHRWSAGLIVGQVALLLVLILGAGLFLRTLHNLNSVNLGFDRSNVLLVTVDPFGSPHKEDQLKSLSMELPDRIKALPGVKAVSVIRFEPITGGSGVNLSFNIPREGAEAITARNVWVNYVGDEYFKTLGIPVIAGREFNRQDANSKGQVAVVNQAFARQHFGTGSPVGKTITERSAGGAPIEIIGLAGNAKYAEIRGEMEPTVYFDIFQRFAMPLQLLIRTERRPEAVLPSVRAEVRSVMGNLSLRERILADHIDASIFRERLVAHLAALFGGLALLLGVIGLYGVVSNSVGRRTKEIGIRIALGFDRRSAISMVLREVFVLVAGGIILGLPLAMLMTRSLNVLLYGLAPDDPTTIIMSVGALLLSAFIAGFIPARRAARVDPMVVLRDE